MVGFVYCCRCDLVCFSCTYDCGDFVCYLFAILWELVDCCCFFGCLLFVGYCYGVCLVVFMLGAYC